MRLCSEKDLLFQTTNSIMEQETKDILAIQQIKGAAKLLNGEIDMQTIVYSNGTSKRKITITYEDRDLFSHSSKTTE